MLIKNMLLSYYDTQALYIASKLKIADILESGEKNIIEIADFLEVSNDKLYRIMRYLSAKGIFIEGTNKIFSNNKQSKFLLTNSKYQLNAFIELHAKYFYKSATNLLAAIKDDSIPFEIEYGEKVWPFLQSNQQANNIFNEAMAQNSYTHIRKLLDIYDFSNYKRIVDLGGGIGSFIIEILKKYSYIKGVCLDLPNLEEKAKELIREQGLANRCQYLAGSFLEEIPKHADLYILKAILHGKNDKSCKDVLINCIDALPNNGRILVIDRVIIKDSDSYIDGCVNDINMLNVSQGKDRSLDEFIQLFKSLDLNIENLYQVEQSLFAIELSK